MEELGEGKGRGLLILSSWFFAMWVGVWEFGLRMLESIERDLEAGNSLEG